MSNAMVAAGWCSNPEMMPLKVERNVVDARPLHGPVCRADCRITWLSPTRGVIKMTYDAPDWMIQIAEREARRNRIGWFRRGSG